MRFLRLPWLLAFLIFASDAYPDTTGGSSHNFIPPGTFSSNLRYPIPVMTSTNSEYPDGCYSVGRIVDGDTFDLASGMRVRLIGVNTPEIGEPCYDESIRKLASLIEGKNVYLEKDVSEVDQFGRLLRYVFLECGDGDGEFVNLKIVRSGFAFAVEYPPDITNAAELNRAENYAIDNNLGCLWGGGSISDFEDDTVIVFSSGGGCFLSSSSR